MLEDLNVLFLAFCIPDAEIIRLGHSAVRILGRNSYLKFKNLILVFVVQLFRYTRKMNASMTLQ